MSKFQLILLAEPLKARAGEYLLIGDGRVAVKTPDQIAGAFFSGDQPPQTNGTAGRDISPGSFRRLRVLTRDNDAFERRLWLFDQIKREPGHKLGHYRALMKAANPRWSDKQVLNYTGRDMKALLETEIVHGEGETKRRVYHPARG